MNAPRRLLSDPQADPLTRKLLGAGRSVDPPAGASRQVWLALSTQIPPPPGAPPPGGAPPAGLPPAAPVAPVAPLAGAAAKTGAVAVFVKPALVGVALMGAVLGGSAVRSSLTPSAAPSAAILAPVASVRGTPTAQSPEKAPAPEASAQATSAPSAAPRASASPGAAVKVATTEPAAADTAAPDTAPDLAGTQAPSVALPSPASSVATAEEERRSRLLEEARLVQQGRAAVAAGNTGEALRLLGQAQGMRGVMFQECEALIIEALARGGQGDAASARARAFLDAYPRSPHATRVRTFVR